MVKQGLATVVEKVVSPDASLSETTTMRSTSSEESFHSIPTDPPKRGTLQQGTPSATGIETDEITNHPWLLLLMLFIGYLCLLYCVYIAMPELDEDEKEHFKVPWNLEEAKNLGIVLERYKDDHYWTVLSGLVLVYIFLQTFAIPGSLFLTFLAGFLFPFFLALPLVSMCAATGATFCYALSWLVARRIVLAYFPDEIQQWAQKVNEQGGDILSFVIFLRITPLLPNWFINIAAPLIGVPWKTFWLGTIIGVAPPSALIVQAGRTLNNLSSSTDHISWTSVLVLAIIAACSLIPVWYRRRFN